jgi:succinate dehydrogenase / fumarate reductase cytochrome b subunit
MKKQIMALTGLGLVGFVVMHMLGNQLIYVGDRAFNLYGHAIVSNPLLYLAEAGLAAIFLTHLFLAMRLTIENHRARPEKYYVKRPTGRGATFASSTMPYTGLVILIFLVFHIMHFKFGPIYKISYDGVEVRDLYRLLIEYFRSPLAVAWYLFAMVCLGIHLSHGIWSAFQSLGFSHPKYTPALRTGSKLLSIFVALGFAALPIYCYLQGGR